MSWLPWFAASWWWGMPLVDTNAAAVAVNRKPTDIWNWQRRGKIQPRGRDRKGRNLYDLAEVCMVADGIRPVNAA